MQLLVENKKRLADEEEIQDKIHNAIKIRKNFVFDAGAGAGKTYALVKSLKYIIEQHGEELSKKNKNVLCITYTNAAADNIKSNFGNSEIVKISTIHERIWEFISLYQNALLVEHRKKIIEVLTKIKDDFSVSDGNKWLNDVSDENIIKLKNYILLPETKKIYYASTDHKGDFNDIVSEYGYTLKNNLGKFRTAVKYIYSSVKLEKCLELIDSGSFKEVKYNANFNSDRLHYMQISHDTLLEYGLAICRTYPMFRRIIIDSCPYILIDEYQDTSVNVVKFMSELATDEEHNDGVLIGYYGDKMQSIYDKGVSNNLDNHHSGLLVIEKKYNRRSRDEIINVSDSLRNDSLLQKSIYKNNTGGSFSFHHLVGVRPIDSSHLVSEFVRKEFSAINSEIVHCFVLKNEMLAELSGFKDFLSNIKCFFFFSDQSQKIISRDLNKLDSTIRIVFKLIEFYKLINEPAKTLEDILPRETSSISVFDAKNYVHELNKISGSFFRTFKDYLIGLFDLYQNGSNIFKSKLNELLPLIEFDFSIDTFENYINRNLPVSDSVKENDRIKKICNFMDVDFSCYIKWYEFVSNTSSEPIQFHTYHSTKGLEFENVAVIMEDSFSRQRKYFPEFFMSPEKLDYQVRRNLLYVACSRAIYNMRILYIDPIESFKSDLKKFFGESKEFVTNNL